MIESLSRKSGTYYPQRYSHLRLAENDPRQYVLEELTEFTELNNSVSTVPKDK